MCTKKQRPAATAPAELQKLSKASFTSLAIHSCRQFISGIHFISVDPYHQHPLTPRPSRGLFHLCSAKKIVCAQPACALVHRLNNFVSTKFLRLREAPPPETGASQHKVCECAPLAHRLGGHSAAHHHFGHSDLWIRLRWLSRGPGMGLLRRRRRQPAPHHSRH